MRAVAINTLERGAILTIFRLAGNRVGLTNTTKRLRERGHSRLYTKRSRPRFILHSSLPLGVRMVVHGGPWHVLLDDQQGAKRSLVGPGDVRADCQGRRISAAIQGCAVSRGRRRESRQPGSRSSVPLLQSLSAVSLTKWQHGRHLLILPRMSRSGIASLLAAIGTKLFKGGLSPGLFLQEFKHSIAWEYEDRLQHALIQGRLLVAMVV